MLKFQDIYHTWMSHRSQIAFHSFSGKSSILSKNKFINYRILQVSNLTLSLVAATDITFAYSLDSAQDGQNVCPDLDPNCLTL